MIDSARFFEVNATVTGRRGKLRPGNYTLRQGMTNGAAIDALMQGPKAKVVKTVNVTVPEGLSIREAAPGRRQGPARGLLPEGGPQRALARKRARSARRGAPQDRRGLPVPGHLHAGRRRAGATSSTASSTPSGRTSPTVDMKYAKRRT